MGYDRRQALEALEAGNRVRFARADLKDAIHADATWGTLRDVVAGERDVELAATMRVLDALLSAPGLGPEKAKRLLLRAAGQAGGKFDPLVTFAELTGPRRHAIVDALGPMRERLSDDAIERFAATPRGVRSDVRSTVRRAWRDVA